MDDRAFRGKLEAIVRQTESPQMEFGHVREGIRKSLEGLLNRAKEFGDDSAEWGRVNYHIAMLQDDDAETLQEHLRAALDANAASHFLDHGQALWIEVRIALADLETERAGAAMTRLRDICEELRSVNSELEPRVARLQRIGFLLHEYGQYEAALSENRRSLEMLKSSAGASVEWRVPFQQNIAENLYCLQRFDESLATLEDVRNYAQEYEDYALWTQVLFKQSVLAHEAGLKERAEELMLRCLDVANQSEDEELIDEAQGWLSELRDRQG